MKGLKRLAAGLLALVMVIGLLPVAALAEETGTGHNFTLSQDWEGGDIYVSCDCPACASIYGRGSIGIDTSGSFYAGTPVSLSVTFNNWVFDDDAKSLFTLNDVTYHKSENGYPGEALSSAPSEIGAYIAVATVSYAEKSYDVYGYFDIVNDPANCNHNWIVTRKSYFPSGYHVYDGFQATCENPDCYYTGYNYAEAWIGASDSLATDYSDGAGNNTYNLPEGVTASDIYYTKDGSPFDGIPWEAGTYTATMDLSYPDSGDWSDWPTSISVSYAIQNGWKVTFDPNGGMFADGSTTPITLTANENNMIEAFPTVSRPGYDFFSWATTSNGGYGYDESSTFDRNRTLYANWRSISWNWEEPNFSEDHDSVTIKGSANSESGPLTVDQTISIEAMEEAPYAKVTRVGSDAGVLTVSEIYYLDASDEILEGIPTADGSYFACVNITSADGKINKIIGCGFTLGDVYDWAEPEYNGDRSQITIKTADGTTVNETISLTVIKEAPYVQIVTDGQVPDILSISDIMYFGRDSEAPSNEVPSEDGMYTAVVGITSSDGQIEGYIVTYFSVGIDWVCDINDETDSIRISSEQENVNITLTLTTQETSPYANVTVTGGEMPADWSYEVTYAGDGSSETTVVPTEPGNYSVYLNLYYQGSYYGYVGGEFEIKESAPDADNDQTAVAVAKAALQAATLTVDNSTTAASLKEAIEAIINNKDVTVTVGNDFANSNATYTSAGSVTATVTLSCGSANEEVSVNAAIAQLTDPNTEAMAAAKKAVEDAAFTVSNDTTEETFKAAVEAVVNNRGITVAIENFVKTSATYDAAGKITATIKLACDTPANATIAFEKVIDKLVDPHAERMQIAAEKTKELLETYEATNELTREKLLEDITTAINDNAIQVEITKFELTPFDKTTTKPGSLTTKIFLSCGADHPKKEIPEITRSFHDEHVYDEWTIGTGEMTRACKIEGCTAKETATLGAGDAEVNSKGTVSSSISNSTEVLDAVLTPEEKEQVAAGAKVEIVLNVDKIPEVSAEEKTMLENTATNVTLSTYLEIDLTKVIKPEGSTATSTDIAEAAAGVAISVPAPKDVPTVESGYARSWFVYSIHNGKTYTWPCTYDAATNTIHFTASLFSTYALGYKDSAIPVAAAPASAVVYHVDPTNPKTGDDSITWLWLVLMGVCTVALICNEMPRKKGRYCR